VQQSMPHWWFVRPCHRHPRHPRHRQLRRLPECCHPLRADPADPVGGVPKDRVVAEGIGGFPLRADSLDRPPPPRNPDTPPGIPPIPSTGGTSCDGGASGRNAAGVSGGHRGPGEGQRAARHADDPHRKGHRHEPGAETGIEAATSGPTMRPMAPMMAPTRITVPNQG